MGKATDERRDATGRAKVERAEYAVENAFSTGRADRAKITAEALGAAQEVVLKADEAMEADEVADEATRIYVIARGMGDQKRIKAARERARAARNVARREHEKATEAAWAAYERIKFSDPTKLGFMRLVQILFAIHILVSIGILILTSRDTVSYNSTNIADWIMVVAESVAFWFFSNRYRLARPLCCGIGVFGIVMSAVSQLGSGSFSLTQWLLESSYYLFLILYFTFSARVKAVLVNELSREQAPAVIDDFVIERSGWPLIRNLTIYFFVFSLLGHWMEASMCQLIRLKLVQGSYDPTNTMLWRDWFYPYPMHGLAVVLIALFLYPLYDWMRHTFKEPWKAYALSYVAGCIACASIELTGGLLFNSDYRFWDYRNDFMNFMGQIDLQNTLAFGCAAAAITWFVYPTLERAISRVRPAVMNVVCIIVAAVGMILFSLYVISPPEGVDLGAQRQDVTTADVGTAALEGSIALVEGGIQGLDRQVAQAPGVSDDAEARFKERLRRVEETLTRLLDTDWGGTGGEGAAPPGKAEAAPEPAGVPPAEAQMEPAPVPEDGSVPPEAPADAA